MQKTKHDYKKTLFLIALMIIPLLNFVVFFVYVNGATIISTFIPAPGRDTFYHYAQTFKDVFLGQNAKYAGAFGHTMLAMLINIIILPLAITTAYTFYKKVPAEGFFRIVFYLPSIIALTTLTMAFSSLFETVPGLKDAPDQYGPMASLLKWLGVKGNVALEVTNDSTTYAYQSIWTWVIFFGVFTGLGTNVVLMCGSMMRIPVEVTEALRLEGCGFFREMVSVTLPMIMPTITTWCIMIVTSVFGFSIMPMLVAGLDTATSQGIGRINTIPLIIYAAIDQLPGHEETMKNMQALGVMFSLIMMPLVFLTRWLCEKLTPDISY